MKMIHALLATAALAAAAPLFLHADLANSPATAPSAQAGDFINPNPDHYLFEDQLKPGMKGYGLTVMKGAKIEKFNVEIIDVVKNANPDRNMILVKCTGLGLEEAGIIAGMSGSPVYIDGKLIGAVAYGWGFSKQPIGGVQPIRQMISIPAPRAEGVVAGGTSGRWAADSALTKAAQSTPGWNKLVHHLVARSGAGTPVGVSHAQQTDIALHPLATPLMLSGSSTESLALARTLFAHTGMRPLQAGGGNVDAAGGKRLGGLADTPDAALDLAPGSAIAIPLLSGDMDVSAIGTVTDVLDHKVWAFGHNMLGEGPSQLPIATAYIYTVMPNLMDSFKFGTCVKPVGALVADEMTGIVGYTGAKAATIPLTLTVMHADGTMKHAYHYEMVKHRQFTPEVLAYAVSGTFVAQRRLPAEYTLNVQGVAEFVGMKLPVQALCTSEAFNLSEIFLPVAVLSDNPFENMKLEKVELTATIEPHNTAATIRRIHLDRLTVKPGGTITATVDYAAFQSPVESATLLLKIPADAPEGDFDLVVGSAQAMRMTDIATAPHLADPENIDGLVTTVRQITGYDAKHLYARLILDVEGAAVRGAAQRNLPASKLAILASGRQLGTTPILRTVTAEAPTGAVFTELPEPVKIRIAKDADGRYGDTGADVQRTKQENPATNPLLPKRGAEPSAME